jgi:CheY-like chemotaxis protein
LDVSDSPTARHRVLIVEDEDRLREALHEMLRSSGYETISAEDGLEALDWLSRLPVDLVVTDLLMPGMGGHELIKRIRQTKEWSSIPILLLSGYADLAPYRDLPVDAIQLKPFRLDEFLDRIKQMLGPIAS